MNDQQKAFSHFYKKIASGGISAVKGAKLVDHGDTNVKGYQVKYKNRKYTVYVRGYDLIELHQN